MLNNGGKNLLGKKACESSNDFLVKWDPSINDMSSTVIQSFFITQPSNYEIDFPGTDTIDKYMQIHPPSRAQA